MTKSKTTKRALLISVISLMLCFAMLVGTTFAWFTDSVTSGMNKIVAGNLDVELDYSSDGADWHTVDENTNMFTEGALWEPGYTEVVYLRVRNAGSLALKYKLGINVADKIIGKTADDEDIDLSNFIKFGIVETETAYTADDSGRTAAREAVEDTAVLVSEGYSSGEGHLTQGSVSGTLALVAYMPEEVGNEANYGTGKTQPEIYMGVNLVATQDTVESDSFSNHYDATATYRTAGSVTMTPIAPHDIQVYGVPLNPGGSLDLSGPPTPIDIFHFEKGVSFAAPDAPAADWSGATADFVISFDRDMSAIDYSYSGQNVRVLPIVPVGKFGDEATSFWETLRSKWLPCPLATESYTADTEIKLLEDVIGVSVTYDEICSYIKEFSCGVLFLDDSIFEINVTVSLVLTKDGNTNVANSETFNIHPGV